MAWSEPWSKRHKSVTANTPFSLSNSFAEPLTSDELISFALKRADFDLIGEYNKHRLVYTPNGGSLDLREEIAALYGPQIGPENIVVFQGAQVALQTAATALVDEDSHSIVFSPSYQSIQSAPLHAGSEVTTIQLKPESSWQINPQEVAESVRENTRYMVVNEPNNPTGTLMAKEVQQQLVDIARANDMYILSDEVYRLLEHDPADRLPAMADLYVKGMSCVTLSKPWGGCGITIGWLAMQDIEMRDKIIDTQYFGTACPGRASEILAMMTLRASEQILDKNMKIIRHNFKLLSDFMEKYNEFFEWVKPTAGAIAYVKFKGNLTAAQLGEQLAQKGISIKPAYVFSQSGEDSCYFRVGYGEKIMVEALEALTEFVEEHKAAWRS